MAINLSTVPYQINVYGKIYLIHNRGVAGDYTYMGYRATGGEALIVRSKTDESTTHYHKSVAADYDSDWTNKATITWNVI